MDWMSKIKASASYLADDFGDGMAFPASKDEIIDNARRQRLLPDVIDRLQRIPDKKYANVCELIKESGKEAF